jgi:hypothetical protein
MVSTAPSAYAGGMIKADDDKFISIGMGIRNSFNSQENASPNGQEYTNQFVINNARIYINGGIHKYIKFAFNTECFNCGIGSGQNAFGGSSGIGLLDAIGQFEFNEQVNFWVGRTLVPTERGELNGPFYHAVFDGFRTPFNQADFSGNIGAGGAGIYGRDNGAVFFGKVHPGGTHLQYVASVFTGLQGAVNPGATLKYAGRLTLNLLNDESNPGYYTSGTYYGTAGDILAIAIAGEHQKDGTGTSLNRSDFTSFVSDILFEKVMPNNAGVFTANAEVKRMWGQDLSAMLDGSSGANAFRMFTGTSWTAYALYLLPQEVGIGKFQPYGRYTDLQPLHGSNHRTEWELGLNYVIAGHNARISTYWRYGDIATNFLNYAPTASGQKVDSFHIALQLQY